MVTRVVYLLEQRPLIGLLPSEAYKKGTGHLVDIIREDSQDVPQHLLVRYLFPKHGNFHKFPPKFKGPFQYQGKKHQMKSRFILW